MKNYSAQSGAAVLEPAVSSYPQRARREALASAEPAGISRAALGDFDQLLGIEEAAPLRQILSDALFAPLDEAASHPGKRIRAQLVHLSYRLVRNASFADASDLQICRVAAQSLELIHLGSLIVDDIEDGSQVRRGRPALHMRYGTPLALNAGNWLYFWSAELLRQLGLPQATTLRVYEHYHRTMLRAHFGQTADLGCRADNLPQSAVASACLATMELKTGALMGFAAGLGGAVANAPERVVRLLDGFGNRLGVALQMFDDLGNVIGRCEPAKRFEDLLMKRLCWVWACAAKLSSAADYQKFIAAVTALPDESLLNSWMDEQELIPYVRQSARSHLEAALRFLKRGLHDEALAWSKDALTELGDLTEEIAVAYE